MSRPFAGTPRLVAMRCCADSRAVGYALQSSPGISPGLPRNGPKGSHLQEDRHHPGDWRRHRCGV